MRSSDQSFYPFYRSCDCGHQMIMRVEKMDRIDDLIERPLAFKIQTIKLCYVCFACGRKDPLPDKQFRLIEGVGGVFLEVE